MRAICLVSIPNNAFLGALVYFILASLMMIFCSVAHWKFHQLEFVKYHIELANNEKMRTHRRISGVGEEGIGLIPSDINKSPISNNRITGNTSNYLPATPATEEEASGYSGKMVVQTENPKAISEL